MSNPTAPDLYRQESEISKSDINSLDAKDLSYQHNETVAIPQFETILEDDEHETGNVGAAAYEKSKHMAEIVSQATPWW